MFTFVVGSLLKGTAVCVAIESPTKSSFSSGYTWHTCCCKELEKKNLRLGCGLKTVGIIFKVGLFSFLLLLIFKQACLPITNNYSTRECCVNDEANFVIRLCVLISKSICK